jgi:hypothetical protein
MEQSLNTNNMDNSLYDLRPPSPPEEFNTNSIESPPTTTQTTSSPTVISEGFQPGQFLYIEREATREMLQNAWLAIQQTETADFVRQDTESFQWSGDQRIWIIIAKMAELGYDLHSGCSFGWTMRQMQFIYRYGENEFRKRWLSNSS